MWSNYSLSTLFWKVSLKYHCFIECRCYLNLFAGLWLLLIYRVAAAICCKYMTAEIQKSLQSKQDKQGTEFSDKRNLLLRIRCLVSIFSFLTLAQTFILLLELPFCGKFQILSNPCICLWDSSAFLDCSSHWYFCYFVFLNPFQISENWVRGPALSTALIYFLS